MVGGGVQEFMEEALRGHRQAQGVRQGFQRRIAEGYKDVYTSNREKMKTYTFVNRGMVK